MITTTEGEDLTEKILSHKGLTVFMISKKLAEAGKNRILDGFGLARYCFNNGIDFYVLTASGSDEIRNYENGLQFCTVDETTLKTMIRANPGYMLLEDGVIKGKWSWTNLPDKEWFGSQVKTGF
jgi:triosephosphate isomerase